jgi:hypothetical protein
MATILRVRATLTYGTGGPGLFTSYHSGSPGGGTLAEAQAASDRVRGSWDVVKTILSNQFTVAMQPNVDVLNDQDGSLIGSWATTPLGNVTGTAATGLGPSQVMAGLVLNTNTVVDGRRLRGRINVGPVGSGSTNAPVPPTGVNTAINAMGVALVTVSPPALTAPIVVWHRPKVDESGTVVRLGSSSPVLSAGVATKWFTLRSRRDG